MHTSERMAEFTASTTAYLPQEVEQLLSPAAKDAGLSGLLSALIHSVETIGTNLRNGHYSHDAVGSHNAFGDAQLHVDVKTDELIFAALRSTRLVSVASSEENPIEVDCGGEGFSVAFDPLDGSSIVDANFAVGTIIGIYSGRGFIGRTGRDQVASMIVQYGPRITLALALNNSASANGQMISMELSYAPDGWYISTHKIVVKPACKTFAPGNLRATSDNLAYKTLVDYWINNKYTLRYSGGLVPDVYHILVKEGGVLSNASSKSAKAKLRLLYECAPIALIMEAAGGQSCVCPSEAGEVLSPISLLDVPITDLDRRVGVCYGSAEEVQRFKSLLFV